MTETLDDIKDKLDEIEERQKQNTEILEELKRKTTKNTVLLQTTVSKLMQMLDKYVNAEEAT